MLILVLGTLAATGPLATDLYLPAFPQIADDLGAPEAQIQMTLTAAMLGLAVGQLLIGPLSDAFGRRVPLLIGIAAFTATAVLCMFVPNASMFIALRFVQGVAGAAGAVICRAIIRDHFSGDEMTRFVSRMMLVTMLAPMFGPILGAQLLHVGPWQIGFAVLGVVATASFFMVWRWLPESLPAADRRPMNASELGGTIWRLLRDVRFIGPTLTVGLSFAALFTYLSSFSFVSQEELGATATQYSIIFGINTVGLLAGTQLNSFLIGRVAREIRMATGIATAVTGVVIIALVNVTGLATLWSVTIGLSIMMLGLGGFFPNASAMAMSSQPPPVAGTASALLGTTQFACGGGLSMLATLTPTGEATLTSMSTVMLGLAVASGAGYLVTTRLTARRPAVVAPVAA